MILLPHLHCHHLLFRLYATSCPLSLKPDEGQAFRYYSAAGEQNKFAQPQRGVIIIKMPAIIERSSVGKK